MDPFQRSGLNLNKKDMVNTVVIQIMILENHSKLKIRYITACMDALILDHISLRMLLLHLLSICHPSPPFFLRPTIGYVGPTCKKQIQNMDGR